MVKAFEETAATFAAVAALEAGQAAGGDTRGMQAASMVIVKKGAGVWLNNDTVLGSGRRPENPTRTPARRRSWNASRAKGGTRAVKPGQKLARVRAGVLSSNPCGAFRVAEHLKGGSMVGHR
jgi:uncharacterized Ntn-hydrolase superfamily protein